MALTRLASMLVHLLACSAQVLGVGEHSDAGIFQNFHTRAWTFGGTGIEDWPELDLPEIAAKPSIGLAFSGGGSRAYTASLGVLAALRQLGLLKRFRYMTGVSGGSWAVSMYTYAKHEYGRYTTPTAPFNMTVLLGDIVTPHEVTMENLKIMPRGCAREAATRSLYDTLAEYSIDPLCKDIHDHNTTCNGDQIWYQSIADLYLRPVGIVDGQLFSWDEASVANITARNPSLDARDFALPSVARDGLPYPIIGVSMLGPRSVSPFDPANRSYTMLECSPLYIGQPRVQELVYSSKEKPRHFSRRTVGGFIEPFAFGGAGPTTGLAAGQSQGILAVQRPVNTFSIGVAVGASSFAPESILVQDFKPLADALGIESEYWSPVAASPAAESKDRSLLGDGGITDNDMMIPLLRRGVRRIVACFNSNLPLQTNASWDPRRRPPTADDIDADIPSYFGHNIPQTGQDLHRNQVFPLADFVGLVEDLQAAQAAGGGIIAVRQHTTVENSWWGIAANHTVEVVWVLLGRALDWEEQLPPVVRKHVQPFGRSNPNWLAEVSELGPFRNFPNYGTETQLELDASQANLLADFTGWVVLNNADIFRQLVPSQQP